MSWSGFKKAVDRAGTSLKQKTGAIEKTVDRTFDEQEHRLRTLEQNTEDLHKHAKEYIESIRNLAIGHVEVARAINLFYDEGGELSAYGRKYMGVVFDLEESHVDLAENMNKTVLDPLNQYREYFPKINETIKKRGRKLLDYDAHRAKVRKVHEKGDSDKLSHAEASATKAQEIYENINRQLIEQMPKVADLRIAMLDSSFSALVKSQLKFAQEAQARFESISTDFQPDMMQHQVQGKVDDIMAQLRDLTICGLN
ncbi:BAR-domain-containing protein [Basidiobolus meristosporus CBS 931.73]|uniref:BAR-domain-containing protein n=1 Tax=Basidiobolus meristosporus CBS 931.73 TaxID=1314790 RepID=A0A1Y1ZDD2_9FUNG|nr:BAR-domain-containing protein [Basidiobolus meristosporus CBS 931.73]|eukprot:ORY07825.1 BAR-domain-containing protein [Basidiobolus meristosporus CBS 931.73]